MQNPRYSSTAQLRQSSIPGTFTSQQSGQSPALIQRINEKKEELDNLIQLRDLSGALAKQMEELETKLSTLADGTEAVAHVLANWQNVLRAISMASTPLSKLSKPKADTDPFTAEAGNADANSNEQEGEEKMPLPVTLVRIPTQHYQSVAPR